MTRLTAFCRREIAPWSDDLGRVAILLGVIVFAPHLPPFLWSFVR